MREHACVSRKQCKHACRQEHGGETPSLPPRKLHEGWMHRGQRRGRRGGKEGTLNVLHTALNNETHEGGGTCAPSIPLPDSSISRLSGESTFPSSTRDASSLPHPYQPLLPRNTEISGWMDGRTDGRKGEAGRIRGGRVARLLRIFENVSAERRGGEGVESVMSRNLGVPRIYSRWRGGSTNRACREFAIVIREYGGWFVLWTRLAACNWRMPVFRFFFRVCCPGHACAAILWE